MLDVLNLSCARGDRVLFRELSFRLDAGEMLHVTGRNGAGKTTLLRTLCGLTRALEGEIRWAGRPVRHLGDEFHAQFSWLGHLNGIQGELSLHENLLASARLAGRADTVRADAALARLALDPYRDFPAKILSQGQKRRLALARLLMLERPLWVLDEPIAALDVDSVAAVSALLAEQLARGGMVVLTSHQALDAGTHTHRTLSLDA